MKEKLAIQLRKHPYYLFLLPLFFVLHGSRENYPFVPARDAAVLLFVYLLAAAVLLLTARLFFKNWQKAALASAILLSFHFFFGAIHDTLKGWFPASLVARYSLLVPLSLVLITVVFILLKRRKGPFSALLRYLNVLFLVLILVETGRIVLIALNRTDKPYLQTPKEFAECAGCEKPDVYVIIADEYPGNTELKDLFGFDNTKFLNQLSGLGFHVVPRSSSNYNYTPYSIASILDMDYLDLSGKDHKQQLLEAYRVTRDNRFVRFFRSRGYEFYNLTLTDYEGRPAAASGNFLPLRTRLITDQTFLSRVNKEIRFHLVSSFKSQNEIKRLTYGTGKNNEYILTRIKKIAAEDSRKPKLVLAHLMMPHYPYYYDSAGRPYPFEEVVEGNQGNKEHFIEYLQYCNGKYLDMFRHILSHSTKPPVIVFLGDHGFRHFREPVDMKYHYMNMTSVFLPGRNYAAFGDSQTSVNLLRSVMNTEFGQRLPYLRDTAYIMEQP